MRAKVRQSTLVTYLKYLIASVFVIWHSGALLIAPAPASYMFNEVRSWYEPYLSLLNLNNGWAFFAPDPGLGTLVQYIITDDHGKEHRFDFSRQLDRNAARFQRYTSMLETISKNVEPYTESAGLHLCNQHKALHPVQIQFRIYDINIVIPEDYLQGARPLDETNLDLKILEPIRCPV